MRNSTSRPERTLQLTRRHLMAAAASSAVVLLAACSSPSNPNAPTASATPAPRASSTPAPATASAVAPTPSAQSAVKTLVAGFPTTVLPLMSGATLQASSIEHSTPVSVASLTASVNAPSADVLAYYSKAFTDQGFSAQPGDAVDGVPTKTFVRAQGQEIATVLIVQTGSTATFTLGATLLPTSCK